MIKIRKMLKNDIYEVEAAFFCVLEDSWNKYERGFIEKETIEFDKIMYSADKLGRRIESLSNFQFVAELDGKIEGFIWGVIESGLGNNNGLCKIQWIGVEPLKQKKGIGQALLKVVENEALTRKCHKITLFVPIMLNPALCFFLKEAFIPEAYLRKEWGKIDYLKMSRWLD
jgi:GNAT superfamily N-acetyltransferase